MLDPLKLNVPWQFPLFYFFIIGMTVDTFVKKALSKWVCLVWTMLVERHRYVTIIITRIIISVIVPDPILCVMPWNHLWGSSPDYWSTSCSAKVSKLLEEGRLLEKVSGISFCKIVHLRKHYYAYLANEIWFFPNCKHWTEMEWYKIE